jgi:hypothetical protein
MKLTMFSRALCLSITLLLGVAALGHVADRHHRYAGGSYYNGTHRYPVSRFGGKRTRAGTRYGMGRVERFGHGGYTGGYAAPATAAPTIVEG